MCNGRYATAMWYVKFGIAMILTCLCSLTSARLAAFSASSAFPALYSCNTQQCQAVSSGKNESLNTDRAKDIHDLGNKSLSNLEIAGLKLNSSHLCQAVHTWILQASKTLISCQLVIQVVDHKRVCSGPANREGPCLLLLVTDILRLTLCSEACRVK